MDAGEIEKAFSAQQNYKNVPVAQGEMSPLERFNNIMDYKKADRIIDAEFGYWDETLRRWHGEGLPEYINSLITADIYFGFDVWKKRIPSDIHLRPLFERQVLEDDGRHQIILNEEGIKCEIFSDGKDSIPHYLEFPIKDRDSYQKLKERLNPETPGRYPDNLEEIGKQVRNRNYVLEARGGSTAGKIRNLMGFEGICLAIYDQPDLLDEILEDFTNITTYIARKITEHIAPDLVCWWEDIAFKNGPIVTPDFFIEKCGRAINRVMSIYQSAGTKYGYVDCDGDIRKLVPGWINNGVNIMFPLEVASGIHPENLRKAYPNIRMMGGVDKKVLTAGHDAIKKELLRLKPLVEEGGFIPHVDHRVQADVSLKDYLYYLEVKRDIYEIPNKVRDDDKVSVRQMS
jgi:uroporphyrinogen decarboxylase